MAWDTNMDGKQSRRSQTPGSVAGKTPRPAKVVVPEGTFVPDVDPFSLSTTVLDTAPKEILLSETSKPDTTSASGTTPRGQHGMVWTLSPLEFLNTQPDFDDEDLLDLDPVTLRKLKQYSEGNSIPTGTSVLWILQFLMDGGLFDGEFNVGQALTFYLTNYWPEF